VTADKREETILKLARNPRLAHATLFQHRHPQETPNFHYDIIDLWHSDKEQVLTEVFRGGAKSTLAEEAIVLMAVFRVFKNCVIGGESEPRALERLGAIKHELETNQYIEDLFGSMVGATWQERKIVLANGVCIQAIGRGQSMRGTKHLSQRPDLFFGDDLEDEESVATPEARTKFMNWFMRVVRPAMAKKRRMRIAGTRLDPDSFIIKLQTSPHWTSVKIPWEFKDPLTGERRATWPAMFPLEKIDQTRQEYIDVGDLQGYMQEYMCEASDPASRTFTAEQIRVEPTVRTWQAVYAMYDPARTTTANKSALTGKAVWSWVNNRLVVWDAGGGYWKPDEIIADMFAVDETYRPIKIGVEQTGLHEFIMQPLRAEQVRRGYTMPIVPLNAPVLGQIGVIKGLQPWFKAREVIFAKEFPELVKQMLAFPTGQRDILNALAYAPRLRPGQPIYDGFRTEHIVDELELKAREQVYLVLNATGQYTTAQLCQFNQGVLYVTHDWVSEGDPGASLSDIVAGASVAAGRALRIVGGPAHFDAHDVVGLRPACAKVPVELHRGGPVAAGREAVRTLLSQSRHGQPAVAVGTRARWTLNAFSGGYCRAVAKSGMISEFAEDGAYKVLMEGLESFAAMARAGVAEDDSDRRYAYTPQGRRYLSALAR